MRTLLLLLTALALVPVARADVLDQSFTGPGAVATVDANATFSRAQTFTVGVTGTLTRVQLGLAESETLPTDVLTIDIRPTDDFGAPVVDDGSALGVVQIPSTALGGTIDAEHLFEIDFTSAAIQVTEGDVLAIVASSEIPSGQGRTLALGGVIDGSYDGGDGWIGGFSWAPQNGGDFDLLFQTYVEAPEPAGAAVAAAIALAVLSRRRS